MPGASGGPSSTAASDPEALGARGALGRGQHARAPVVLGRHEVVRADDDHAAAGRELQAELAGARDQVAPVGDLAPQHGPQEGRGRRRRRAFGGAQALDL